MPRMSVIVMIRNRLGMHARPAMSFVDAASGYTSTITVRRVDGVEEVDGKSIMQVMMLAATKGTELEVVAEGDDASEACARLQALVDSGFNEE